MIYKLNKALFFALHLQILRIVDKDRFNTECIPDDRHQGLDTGGFRGIVTGDKKVHSVFLCRIVHGQIYLADEKTIEPVDAASFSMLPPPPEMMPIERMRLLPNRNTRHSVSSVSFRTEARVSRVVAFLKTPA